ncbi:MAG: c-type cytochrome [Gammaproteobacteria bacterium]|nr:c-type cytochrome [Gammaproteobacteria bacterium]
MIRLSVLLGVLLASFAAQAIDLENGKRLHRSCALCHGQLSQGTIDGKYPRIAGMREDYMIKQMEDYKEGVRNNLTMTLVGRIKTMSETDMEDVAGYIRSINLKSKEYTLNIPTAEGDVKQGKKMFRGDCKSCHGKRAEGIARKGAPMLAGQYTAYLASQIEIFKAKERYHDNDKDDETFKEYTADELQSILAYISTLDD